MLWIYQRALAKASKAGATGGKLPVSRPLTAERGLLQWALRIFDVGGRPVTRNKPRPTHAATNPATLKQRVRRALHERRWDCAFELAQKLAEEAPEPAHREQLLEAGFGYAEQLLSIDHGRAAGEVLGISAEHVQTPEERGRLAV